MAFQGSMQYSDAGVRRMKNNLAAKSPNPDFALGGKTLTGALDQYKRPNYGIPSNIANAYRSDASSAAYTANMGVKNQILRGLRQRGLGRSAAVLSAPQAGARAGAETLQQLLQPFALQNAQFAEGQRTTDLSFGQRLLELLSRRDLTKAQLAVELERIRAAKDAQPNFGIQTPFGGISF